MLDDQLDVYVTSAVTEIAVLRGAERPADGRVARGRGSVSDRSEPGTGLAPFAHPGAGGRDIDLGGQE